MSAARGVRAGEVGESRIGVACGCVELRSTASPVSLLEQTTQQITPDRGIFKQAVSSRGCALIDTGNADVKGK